MSAARPGSSSPPMIRQLRRKLVAVILIIATFMLCVIFGLIYRSTAANLSDSSLDMLRRVAMEPMRSNKPGRHLTPEKFRLPYFVVTYDSTGTLLAVEGENYDLSDTASIQSLLAEALGQNENTGLLRDYALRYLRLDAPLLHRIAFVDCSYELATLSGLLRSFAVIGLAALLVFWVLGLLLARWVSRPVERAWRQQQQFVADASHELKTPLTVIMTNAELLSGEDCTESDLSRCVSSILTMSRQMKALVEEMLDLARTESAAASLTLTEVDFSRLVEESLLPFEAIFFEQGIAMESAIAPGARVMGDAQRLGQVLDILLDNAVKYSAPPRQIWVKLSAERHRCRLEVANTGEGISPEECEALFKRFYRSDKARSHSGSFGLGLSIAKAIVERHHGRMGVKSKDGVNTFFVELPPAHHGGTEL